jgi:hypothetical protein
MMRSVMKTVLMSGVLLGAGLVAPLGAEEKKEEAAPVQALRKVNWDDLKATVEFEDPFEKLTEEQLMDLGIIARVQSLEKRDDGKSVSEGMRKEAAAARAKLERQKVDVEGLFAKRHEITELRRKRANAAVPELAGKLLALPGFVLPIEYEGKKVTEFLLVPWVGACIHTPPPPPNQIVHIIAKTPFETKGMFEAVTVTGVMKLGDRKTELYLVDGKADINMTYSMADAGVVNYKKGE